MTDAFDQVALAGPEHLDPAYVAGYDRKAAGFDPAADLALLRAHGVGDGATLVDLGCGTGTFAVAAARTARRVVAADVSQAMLTAARAKAVAAGAENVEVVEAGFLDYTHHGAPPDAVYTRHALHHLPDTWKAVALARIAALLRPGGVLLLRDLVWAFEPAEAETAIAAWIAGGRDDPADGWTKEEFETHVRTEHSTYTWLLEPMLDRAGFDLADVEVAADVYARYLCVRR